MKTRIFMLLTVAAMAGLLITACQKEQQTDGLDPLSAEQVYTPKASKLVQEINSFKQKMTVVRENPHLKSGELMSKEEARWNIETLFNVTYGFPDDAYGRTVSDSTTVYLPVDASGNALLEDVVAVYDQIHDLVSQFYLSHNFEEKGFLLLQLQTGEVSGNQMEIFVRAVTGEKRESLTTPPINYGPFFEGDDWWFGYDLGKCDYSVSESDAAKQLQLAIHSSMIWWPEPPNGYRWMTANPFNIELVGDEYQENGEYLIFYVENFTDSDKCLDSLKMNFHYYGQVSVIYQKVPLYHPLFPDFDNIEQWRFLECEIEGKQDETYSGIPRIRHENKLTYAEVFLVPIWEIPYPIELTALALD
jgi:hypothetical protein